MNMSYMKMKKGKRGKMMSGEGCHTSSPKAPPGAPAMPMKVTPNGADGIPLEKSTKSGKNRDRKSFSEGHQW